MGITSTLPLPPTQGLSITFSIDFSMVVQAVTNGIGTAKADFSNTLTVTSIELLDAADHLIPGIGYAAGSGRWYPVANIQPGDFNHDGHVDSGDFTVWVADVGETGVTPDHGDGDSDTDVDGGDFLLWQRQLGTTSLLPSTTTVPEPATAALIMCALLGARCSSKTRRSPGIGA